MCGFFERRKKARELEETLKSRYVFYNYDSFQQDKTVKCYFFLTNSEPFALLNLKEKTALYKGKLFDFDAQSLGIIQFREKHKEMTSLYRAQIRNGCLPAFDF